MLQLALPMILATASSTIQRFVDRMFLGWYSPDALAASLPSGVASFTLACLFFGTAGYVNTFVAQYTGAGRPKRVGAAVWQGMYFSLMAAVVLAACSLFAEPLFELVGHEPSIRPLEADYFRILTLGGGAAVACAALSGFYSGRGRMKVVMWVNVVMTVINVTLNYCWIFGRLGFPEMGMRGAAWATVCSMFISMGIYLVLFLLPENRREYATASSWRIDRELLGRLLRYGLPSGVHFFVDIFAFTLFVFLAGRLGKTQLAATNIAFGLNMLIFMPMIGFAVAISTLVGQSLGRNQPAVARRSTTSAAMMASVYMILTAGSIALVPDPFINLFRPLPPDPLLALFTPLDPEVQFAPIRHYARVLLLFVAVYSVFDVANLTFAAALRGAGDTVFPMIACLVISVVTTVVPVWIAIEFCGAGLYTAWVFLTLWVITMGVTFYVRYRGGRWESMRVIEAVPAPQVAVQEGPVLDVETAPVEREPIPPDPTHDTPGGPGPTP